jgi:hypothetical protein
MRYWRASRGIRWLLPVLASTGILMGLVACGANDADVGARDKGSAKALINMPDLFSTVAVKCYEGNGIYVTSTESENSSSLYVVKDDPVC